MLGCILESPREREKKKILVRSINQKLWGRDPGY